ncbi:beta-glucosidase [Mobilisporobacter senegalensis]|uniref:Beta-glucosidase n=1 Tax=Mobilisporobacter senegalensis TaxID=1329262 RepID=A0A3N1XMS3_9FIRM|nr:glycoside hydrolase family 3 C-terminal domain-containing protein [Mobilisporobacter senegalensis]ROR27431.1 beta-glucosidase [Mobilisporobacter senegalensis]
MNEQKVGIPLKGFAEFSRKVAAEGAVLLKNDDQILPIGEGEIISVFGRTQINYYRSGTGSGGAVNVEYTTNLLDGLRNGKKIKVNEELAKIYEDWIGENPFDNGGGGWAAEPWNQKEMFLPEEIVIEARAKSEKGIVVIGRTAGEDKDNADIPGSYQLTQEEKDMLEMVCKHFEQVVVVLNVAGIIDMNWMNNASYQNSLKGVIYVWQGGIEGGNAAADVLTGVITPGGKLTDTIAYSIKDYPSTSNYGGENKNYYQEDIYVGYRYFETFCPEKVQFEFGYGLSYTDFNIRPKEVKIITKESKEYIQLEAEVTNIGKQFPGKEVVQVYYEAPQGKLGKPVKELGAFEKTKTLQPGESQNITLCFQVNDMASYDDSGITGYPSSYVLEKGDYHIYLGNSVRNIVKIEIDEKAVYHVEETRVIEQLEQALAPVESFMRITTGERKVNGTYEVIYGEVPIQTISLKERIEENQPKTIRQTGNQGIKLRDVYEKKANMEEFIAQLTNEELATIVRAEGMSSPKVTPGTASAFGGVGDSLFDYGIPIGCTADGPSGIRMESGLKATQLPIGTLLAATWDKNLVEELYEMEGRELLSNHIDILLGPGLNIHRNPLNGRNFEYYSEDPLVTGVFASAVVRGIMKGGSNATLKHFACNNQEKARSVVDAIVSERALREIYLKGFEIAVKQSNANSVMTSYNPINGHYAASNYDLNTTILRKEWGFKGIVMTDWWAKMNDVITGGPEDTKSTNHMVRAQNDLYMVINNNGAEINSGDDNTIRSLENGSLTIGELQRSAMNICRFLMEAPVFFRKQETREIVTKYKARKELLAKEIQHLYDDSKIAVKEKSSVSIEVSKAGVYGIIVNIMSPDTNLSQTTCNVILNDEFMVTIQTSGTDGRWITQKLIKIELEEGFYELKLDFVKPGMQIDWIQFNLVK